MPKKRDQKETRQEPKRDWKEIKNLENKNGTLQEPEYVSHRYFLNNPTKYFYIDNFYNFLGISRDIATRNIASIIVCVYFRIFFRKS